MHGAGATIVRKSTNGRGILSTYLKSDGTLAGLLLGGRQLRPLLPRLALAFGDWWLHLAASPGKLVELQRKAARKLLSPTGVVLVVDENVGETFTAPGSDLERLFYGFSILACLPNGLGDKPSAATAAKKAFLVTRLGDVSLLLGLLIVYNVFGTFAFREIFAQGDLIAANPFLVFSTVATESGAD